MVLTTIKSFSQVKLKRYLEFPRVGNKSLDFIILLRQDRASFAFRAFSCLEINICKKFAAYKGIIRKCWPRFDF